MTQVQGQSGEDVKTPEETIAGENPKQDEPSTDPSEEGIEKDWKDEAKKKGGALKEAREMIASMKEELESFRKEKESALKKEEIKKGNFEKVIQEQEEKLKDYESKLKELSGISERYNSIMDKQLEDVSKRIPDSEKDFVNNLIEGKNHEEKLQILNKFAETFGKEYSPKSPTGVRKEPTEKPKNSKEALNNLANAILGK